MGWFRKKPKIWLVRINNIWSKVVCVNNPETPLIESIGPIRSEVDAEETCDHLNHAACNKVLLYNNTTPQKGD